MIRTELNVKLLFQVVNRGFGDTPMTWKEEMLPRAFLNFLLSSFFKTKVSSGQPNHWVLLPIELVRFFSISSLLSRSNSGCGDSLERRLRRQECHIRGRLPSLTLAFCYFTPSRTLS